MISTEQDPKHVEIAQNALLANKQHQRALRLYTENLEAELQSIDQMLEYAEAAEEDLEVDVGGSILVPGSERVTGPILPSDILSEDSPFYDDAQKRQRYLDCIDIHIMSNKTLESLAEAIRTENYRIHAYEAQQRGEHAFVTLAKQPQAYFEQNKEGINWELVAEKVNGKTPDVYQRTPRDCEIRWLGDRHPGINHATWSAVEIERVRALVDGIPQNEIDWVDVAKQLGTDRTPIDCMRHAIPRKWHTWDAHSDVKLIKAIKIYGTDDWHRVARLVSEDVTPMQCSQRYRRTLSPGINRGDWSLQEDERLLVVCELHGNAWADVAALMPGRLNEQCRDRYSELVQEESENPAPVDSQPIEGGNRYRRWKKEEDNALLKAVERFGRNNWEGIAKAMGDLRSIEIYQRRFRKLWKQDAARDVGESSSSSNSDADPQPEADAEPPAEGEERPLQPKPTAALTRVTARGRGEGKKRAVQPQFDPLAATEAGMELATDGATQDNRVTMECDRLRPKPRPRPRAIKKKLDDDGSHNSTASRSNTSGLNEAGGVMPHVDSHNPTLEQSTNTTTSYKTSVDAPLPRADEAGRPTHCRKRKQPLEDVEGGRDESTATVTKKRRKAAKFTTQPTLTEDTGEANTAPLAGTDQDPNSLDMEGGNEDPLGATVFARIKGKSRGRDHGVIQARSRGRGRGRGRGKPATSRSATSPPASSNSDDRLDALQPGDATALVTLTTQSAPPQTPEDGSVPTPSTSKAIYKKRPTEGSRRQPPRIARKSRAVDVTDVND